MQGAYFEGRQLKAYGDFVRAAELVVGRVYFKVSFLDRDMVIPDLSSWVFIGRDLNPGLPGLYFQDADSYLGGVRRGDQDCVPTFEGQPLPDGCGWGDDALFEWERERQYSGVYEFEGALDSLLACSLRRERWDANVRVADAPTESE